MSNHIDSWADGYPRRTGRRPSWARGAVELDSGAAGGTRTARDDVVTIAALFDPQSVQRDAAHRRVCSAGGCVARSIKIKHEALPALAMTRTPENRRFRGANTPSFSRDHMLGRSMAIRCPSETSWRRLLRERRCTGGMRAAQRECCGSVRPVRRSSTRSTTRSIAPSIGRAGSSAAPTRWHRPPASAASPSRSRGHDQRRRARARRLLDHTARREHGAR